MHELVSIVGIGAAAFVGSAFVGLQAGRRRPRPSVEVQDGHRLEFVGDFGRCGSRLISASKSGWVVEGPMARQHYLPLRVGDRFLVHAADARGMVAFRGVVQARDVVSHTLTLEPPSAFARVERRAFPRLQAVDEAFCQIDGRPARVLDVSRGGLRALTPKLVGLGSRVLVSAPDWSCAQPFERCGLVLANTSAAYGRRQVREVRIRFDEPLDFAPAF